MSLETNPFEVLTLSYTTPVSDNNPALINAYNPAATRRCKLRKEVCKIIGSMTNSDGRRDYITEVTVGVVSMYLGDVRHFSLA